LNPDVGGYTKTLNHLKKLRTTQQHAENQNISGGRLHLARQGRDIIGRPGSYATDTKDIFTSLHGVFSLFFSCGVRLLYADSLDG